MAAVTRNDVSAVLQTFLNTETLENLRGELYFHQLGQKPSAPIGYGTVAWARFTKLAASDVTAGTTSNDGVTPADTAFTATQVTATPVQYRIVVSLSDTLLLTNKINFLTGAAKEVGAAMAEKIDAVIQTTVNAGDNVMYAGTGNAARADLATGDNLTAGLLFKAHAFLKKQGAKTFGGFYVAVTHPYAEYDLKADTAAGSWQDIHKYARPEEIFKGEIGAIGGVRVLVSYNVQTFASTTTVYPTLVIGDGAFGVSDFANLQVFLTPNTPSDSDPAVQRRKVAAKVFFAVRRLQENAMVRIESAATNLG